MTQRERQILQLIESNPLISQQEIAQKNTGMQLRKGLLFSLSKL